MFLDQGVSGVRPPAMHAAECERCRQSMERGNDRGPDPTDGTGRADSRAGTGKVDGTLAVAGWMDGVVRAGAGAVCPVSDVEVVAGLR